MNILSKFPNSSIVLFIFLLIVSADAIIYSGFLERYLGVTPLSLLMILSMLTLVFRLSVGRFLNRIQFKIWFYFIAPTVSFLAIFLPIIENYTYTNFSFSTFRLHPEEVYIPAIFLIYISLLNINKAFIVQNIKKSIFVLSFYFICLIYYFGRYDTTTLYWHMKNEDSLFEYITAFAFWFCAWVGYKGIKLVKKDTIKRLAHQKFILYIYIAMIVSGLFIGFEEISWGQRLLGIETPQSIAERNTQKELTVHNHVFIIQFVYYGYLALAAYCSSAWISLKLFRKNNPFKLTHVLELITPPWYLLWFFIPTIIYVLGRKKYGYVVVGDWEEVSEMILSIGLLIFVFIRYKQLEKSVDKK